MATPHPRKKEPPKPARHPKEANARITALSKENRQIKRDVSEILELPAVRKRIEITSRQEIVEASMQFNEPEQRQALKMLKSERSVTRMVGIHKVADFIFLMQPEKRKKAIKIIEAMLEDPTPEVVRNAAEILLQKKFIAGSSAEAFAKALDHENPKCRRIAAISLNGLDKKRLLTKSQIEMVLVKVSGALSRETNATPVNQLTMILERHVSTISADPILKRSLTMRLTKGTTNRNIGPESRERIRKIQEKL